MLRIKPEVSELPNGFGVVTETYPHMESVAIGFLVEGGAIDEGEGETGAAHFLEHMMFKGTPSRSAKRVKGDFEDYGDRVGAYTSQEHTFYFARALGERAETSAGIFADMIRNSLIDEGEFEKERGTILQEIEFRRGNPQVRSCELMIRQVYGLPPVIGQTRDIEGISAESVRDFHRRLYDPRRMTMVAVGNLDHCRMADCAQGLFGDMAAGEGGPAEPRVSFRNGKAVEIAEDLDQVYLEMGVEGPAGPGMEPYFRSKVYGHILGGSMSSRLFQRAREERGLCYNISHCADVTGRKGAGAGIHVVSTSATADKIGELIRIVAGEFVGMADGVGEVEMERASSTLRHGAIIMSQDAGRRCEAMAESIVQRGRAVPVPELIEGIESVTAEHVKEYAESVLDATSFMTLYGPECDVPALGELMCRGGS